MNALSNGECLKDIQLENPSAVSHSYHELTPDILPGKNARFVDPDRQGKVVRNNDPGKTIRKGESVDSAVKEAFGTALFSMSEIAFNKDHSYAVVSYSFWCGSLCGHGSTIVFKKVGNQWRKIERNCGGWVS